MRPLSFTKNLGGLDTVHQAIRTGYLPGVTTAEFRRRCTQAGISGDLALVVVQFFLFTQLRQGGEHILGDSLVAESVSRPFSKLLARLYFFALNLHMPGERLRSEQQQAGEMQNAVVRQLLYVNDGFYVDRLDKDHSLGPFVARIGEFTSADASRKWRNNYWYIVAEQCDFAVTPTGRLETFPDTWGPLALRLFFERYVASHPTDDVSTLVAGATQAELHKLIGVPLSWLVLATASTTRTLRG